MKQTKLNRFVKPIDNKSKYKQFVVSKPYNNFKKNQEKKEPEQLILDLGQKSLQMSHCIYCGMAYIKGNLEDEKTHLKFCSKESILSLKYSKSLTIVGKFGPFLEYKIIKIDQKTTLKRSKQLFIDLLKYIDQQLGFCVTDNKNKKDFTAFLCVQNQKIIAATYVESIEECYKTIENKMEYNKNEKTNCLVGVSRIWVDKPMRRKGIASRMLDCVRSNFIYGYEVHKEMCCFSHPTSDGWSFAKKYSNSKIVKIY